MPCSPSRPASRGADQAPAAGRQCRGRHGQQLSAEVFSRQGIAPNLQTRNLLVPRRLCGVRIGRIALESRRSPARRPCRRRADASNTRNRVRIGAIRQTVARRRQMAATSVQGDSQGPHSSNATAPSRADAVHALRVPVGEDGRGLAAGLHSMRDTRSAARRLGAQPVSNGHFQPGQVRASWYRPARPRD